MSSVSLNRPIFDQDHQAFRDTVRAFVQREIVPNTARWAEQGHVDREVFRKAGELGLLGISTDEKFDGGGFRDFRFNAIVIEEICASGATAVSMSVSGFNDLVAPYFELLGTDEQNRRWLTPLVRGEKICAIAMTEPGAGSDLGAISTTALPQGDHFVLKGAKTFISNGMVADTIIVAAKTDPAAGKAGVSLLVVEDGMPGLSKHGPLDKVGLTAQDTAELVFDDVIVPRTHLLGEENKAFGYLRHNLAQERLSIAVASMALAQRTLDTAVRHSNDRTAFGRRLIDFQANRFYLAELATEVEIAQTFIDRCILDASAGALNEVTAAMAKWWVTELHQRVVQRAVQLHGGYGYMKEYSVAHDYLDSRASTIFGGATEIMKEIIGRKLTDHI